MLGMMKLGQARHPDRCLSGIWPAAQEEHSAEDRIVLKVPNAHGTIDPPLPV